MNPDWISFFLFTLLAIVVQGLFALFEMSVVSFNKMRLQYYVSLGQKRAIWLNYLTQRPSRLFGTTLIGINTALQIGSECSRRFYESIHLDPDWAPITQVIIVVIFAELAPMFAARRHPEQLALTLVPLMVLLVRILQPIIWFFDTLAYLIHRMMGKAKEAPLFFSREEVKMAFEEREEGEDELNALVSQIFQMKSRTAGQIMTSLEKVAMVSSSATLAEVRHLLSVRFVPFLPICHRHPHNIVAVLHIRDLLRLKGEGERVLEAARSPWFVTREASALEILNQFRRNNQSVAVILDMTGQACGLLTLDQIVSQIFGEEAKEEPGEERPLYIERTLSGEMLASEFNRQFQADLPHEPEDTLSDLIAKDLEHHPTRGEIVKIGSFSFTVIEPTLTGVKTLSVQSLQE
jgi:CBS domain containing-hemolysin-like protein